MIYVLDSSVILAVFGNEKGASRVGEIIGASYVSTVNEAEVVAKLQEWGMADSVALSLLDALPTTFVPFTSALARASGHLRTPTRHLGLSLGDRCCLALAMDLGATVLTADRAWADLKVGVSIEVIR